MSISKFRHLSFWSKVGVVGSIASIIGLMFVLMPTHSNKVSLSVPAHEGSNPQIGTVQGSGTVIINDNKGVKQETSLDPRKELQNMGVPWAREKFFDAIKQKDYKVTELFLQGGMVFNKLKISDDEISEMVLFVENDFDPRIADTVIKYHTVDPDIVCPVPPNSKHVSYTFYTESVAKDPRRTSFVRKICNTNSVKEQFDKGISALQEEVDKEIATKKEKEEQEKQRQAQQIQRGNRENSFNDPLFLQMDRSARDSSRRALSMQLSISLGKKTESNENQLNGWVRARDLLVGGN